MKNIKSFLVVYIMIFALLCSVPVFAATATNTDTTDTKTLSIVQSKEIAMKDNSEIKLAELTLKQANLSMEQVKYQANKLNKIVEITGGDQNTTYAIDYAPAFSQCQIDLSKTALDYTKNSIAYGVEAAYYGYLSSEKSLSYYQLAYNRASEQLRITKSKYNVGVVSKMELNAAESNELSAKADLDQAKAGLESAQYSLNEVMGLPLDTKLKLTDKLSYVEKTIDVKKALEEAYKKDMTFISADKNLVMAKLNFAYYKGFTAAHTFQYREYEHKQASAQVEYDKAYKNVDLRVRTAYSDLIAAKNNVDVLNKSMNLAKNSYRLAQLRYKEGLSTVYDVINAEAQLNQVELGYLGSLANYNLGVAKFNYGIYGSASAVSQAISMPANM